MENSIKQAFETRKTAALCAAKEAGIIDVVQASKDDGISLETLELATRLTKQHGPDIYKRLEERRKSQSEI